MKKRRIAMYSKEDIAYWMDVFERANRAPVSEKEWCKLNHIPYRQYTGKKYRMKKAGYMDQEECLVNFSEITETFYAYKDGNSGQYLYLYPDPVSSSCKTNLMRIIIYVMKRKPKSTEKYLFQRSDRRAVYVIRITEYGVTLTKVYRKRGVIHWPQKGKGFGQKGMEMLLEMI